jgi:hypothetical protein
MNDRIPSPLANTLPNSLILVAAKGAVVIVMQGRVKRQARLAFRLGTTSYNFVITDPKIEAQYFSGPNGTYPLSGQVLVCVSLGEPFDGYRYKLAAALVPI